MSFRWSIEAPNWQDAGNYSITGDTLSIISGLGASVWHRVASEEPILAWVLEARDWVNVEATTGVVVKGDLTGTDAYVDRYNNTWAEAVKGLQRLFRPPRVLPLPAVHGAVDRAAATAIQAIMTTGMRTIKNRCVNRMRTGPGKTPMTVRRAVPRPGAIRSMGVTDRPCIAIAAPVVSYDNAFKIERWRPKVRSDAI